MKIRTVVLACLAALASVTAHAQTPTVQTLNSSSTKVNVFWERSPSTDPLVGYELVFASAIQTGSGNAGQQLKIVPINDPNALTFEIPVALMPQAPVNEFYVSLRAKTANEVSLHSNSLLFRRAATPGVPGNFRGVVAVALGSLVKPGSGDVTAGSLIATSAGSILASWDYGSNSTSFSPMVVSANGLGLYRLGNHGRSD